MKQTITTLVLLFALLQVGISSVLAQTNLPPTYLKIQVAAYKNLKQAKLDSLFKIGSVYAEDAGNGVSRIVVGYYTDAVTADIALDQVRKSGFPDAFISKHKGAIESKAISLITPATMDALNTQYLVVLGRFNDLKDVKLGPIVKMSDMYVEEDNGMKKIVMGPFPEKEKAETILKTVRENGFNDAVIQSLVVTPKGYKKPAATPSAITKTTQPPTGTSANQPDANKNIPVTTFNAPPETPTTGGTTTRPGAPLNKPTNETTPSNQLFDTGQFFTFFTSPSFKVFHVPPFSPVAEDKNTLPINNPAPNSLGKDLKGNKLPDRLLYLFHPAPSPDLSFFALYRYTLSPSFDGFIIRSGKDKLDQANEITLYIFDKTKMKFVGKELISTSIGKQGFLSTTESWLMDLNADNVPDLLSYTIVETNTPQKEYNKSSSFKAKLWLDNKFMDAQIVNEEALRKQVSIKD